MHPSSFDEANEILGPPVGMTEDECGSLSVFRGLDVDGTPLVISCWRPTPEEVEELRRTGRLWLLVCGTRMPPVSLATKNPFEKI